MQELHLVGFTTDRRGLIFRPSDDSSAEAFVVPVDHALLAAVAGLEPVDTDEVPLDEAPDADTSGGRVERAESRLPVREIQGRLRTGETVARVARAAGVEEDWVERFAPPVRAEQRQVVEEALALHVERPRAGASALPLRRAVATEIAAKGIAFTVPAFEAAWSSRLIGEDRWIIEFDYVHRGHQRTASWELEARTRTLTPHDRLGAQLGFVGEDVRITAGAGLAVDGIVGDLSATPRVADDEPAPRARATTAPAKKKPAKKKPAKKKPVKKKPAKKKSVRKKAPVKKKPAKKKPAKKKPVKKKPAKKKSVRKKAPVKKKPAKKKSVRKRAPVKKKAPVKKRPAKKTPAERATPAERTTPAGKQTVEQRAPADVPVPTESRQAATRRPAERAPVVSDRGEPEPVEPPANEPGRARTAPDERDSTRRRGVVVRSRRPDERTGSDRDSARRARAAERAGSTIQFRSGAAVPASVASVPQTGDADASEPGEQDSTTSPAGAERGADGPSDAGDESTGVSANGAARPRRPRRRQLRAQ